MSGTVDYLSLEDLLEIATGVILGVQVRDVGLLASAAARPSMTAFGEDAYPDFELKAAALLHSLARNHPLVDGNKRLAWSATRVFCLVNGRDISYEIDDAEQLILSVASGALELPEIAVWLKSHIIDSGTSESAGR